MLQGTCPSKNNSILGGPPLTEIGDLEVSWGDELIFYLENTAYE